MPISSSSLYVSRFIVPDPHSVRSFYRLFLRLSLLVFDDVPRHFVFQRLRSEFRKDSHKSHKNWKKAVAEYRAQLELVNENSSRSMRYQRMISSFDSSESAHLSHSRRLLPAAVASAIHHRWKYGIRQFTLLRRFVGRYQPIAESGSFHGSSSLPAAIVSFPSSFIISSKTLDKYSVRLMSFGYGIRGFLFHKLHNNLQRAMLFRPAALVNSSHSDWDFFSFHSLHPLHRYCLSGFSHFSPELFSLALRNLIFHRIQHFPDRYKLLFAEIAGPMAVPINNLRGNLTKLSPHWRDPILQAVSARQLKAASHTRHQAKQKHLKLEKNSKLKTERFKEKYKKKLQNEILENEE